MEASFDCFIDAQGLGARRIAELMREMEVDVAIDLAGYTSDSRIEIFAHRPAPVQATFLGYPGTLGVNYMDYLIADRHVIPPEHQPFFSETVIYLPDCYLPVDSGLRIAERTPSRAECGLPETGPVLCSFSHDYKITPPLWAVWMRILRRTPDSVLWLACRNESTQRNYRKEAQAAGIDPARLVFAGRVPRVEDHLARYRLADLFLDTWPYNAHTTAADALLAGLPVVTFMGNAFPARVAASLLHAAGLPELISESWEAYEELAVSLATDAAALATLKAKLAANRERANLFDTARFTRNLEQLLLDMLDRTLAITR
jgi:predicted O-linked N-acetylglucosamine transferase (SPINDLY family)